jgi:hypothetical protein
MTDGEVRCCRPVVVGRAGPWPFRGHFAGWCTSEGGVSVSLVGRVGAERPVADAWRRAQRVRSTLLDGGVGAADRLLALAVLWGRAEALAADCPDLTLLAVAQDQDGVAVSGVGLTAVWAAEGARIGHWVTGRHPLLGPPGLGVRPGAISVDRAPPWLIAVPPDVHVEDGLDGASLLARCGVRQ